LEENDETIYMVRMASRLIAAQLMTARANCALVKATKNVLARLRKLKLKIIRRAIKKWKN
jgi:hypothetical protein